MGDLTKNVGAEEETVKSLLSPEAVTNGDGEKMDPISEGEDVAERAASMLQGLRGDGEGELGSKDGSGSLRVRRRRESADDERRNRRRRRARESSSTDGGEGTTLSPKLEGETIPEIKEPNDDEDGGDEADGDDPIPKTVVVPPSPEGTELRRTVRSGPSRKAPTSPYVCLRRHRKPSLWYSMSNEDAVQGLTGRKGLELCIFNFSRLGGILRLSHALYNGTEFLIPLSYSTMRELGTMGFQCGIAIVQRRHIWRSESGYWWNIGMLVGCGYSSWHLGSECAH